MENPTTHFSEGQEDPSGFTVENVMNKDDESLPFGYFCPATEGKVTWVCGYGPQKKNNVSKSHGNSETSDIVSVFSCDTGDGTERQVKILENMDQAKYMRDELVKEGWQKLSAPKIEFTVTKDGKKSTTMTSFNRKQKRALQRKLKNVKDDSK